MNRLKKSSKALSLALIAGLSLGCAPTMQAGFLSKVTGFTVGAGAGVYIPFSLVALPAESSVGYIVVTALCSLAGYTVADLFGDKESPKDFGDGFVFGVVSGFAGLLLVSAAAVSNGVIEVR